MFGTSPFAAATFAGAGSERYELTAVAITTGAVTVPDNTMYEEETLGGLFVTSGNPSVDNTSFNQDQTFEPIALDTNAPTVDVTLFH